MGEARGDGEAARFAAEWRQDVMDQFREQSQINQRVNQALAELTAAVSTLKATIDDMRRAPESIRGNLTVLLAAGGCLVVPFISATLAVIGGVAVALILRAMGLK